MQKVDALQVIISTSAIFGIGLVWFNLNQKVFKTVCSLAATPFSRPKKKADYSSNCSDANVEEIRCSDLTDVKDVKDIEPGLIFDLRISSPLFDEADIERLEHKGFKNVLVEILNRILIDKDAEKTD
jgi:hypothetical protein